MPGRHRTGIGSGDRGGAEVQTGARDRSRSGEIMLERGVFAWIKQHQLIRAGDLVFAAVSGGADSVCMLHLLLAYREQCPFELRVVHVEHGIRGAESRQDAAFVRELCDKLHVPCRQADVDAPALAAQEKLSLEEAARKLRYRVFEECVETDRPEKRRVHIALAHNMEDQAETMLFNLARGSGLLGLAGMPPARGAFIRPLLSSSRADIEAYLRERGIAWRTDSTNLSESYTRNRIRSRILPLLTEQVNSRAAKHIWEAASQAGEAEECLRKMAAEDLAAIRIIRPAGPLRFRDGVPAVRPDTGPAQDILSDRLVLDAGKLSALSGLRQTYALREALRMLRRGRGMKDISREHIRAVSALLSKHGEKHADLPGGICAVRSGNELILTRAGTGKAAGTGTADGAGAADGVGTAETAGMAAGGSNSFLQVTGDGDYEFMGLTFRVRMIGRDERPASYQEQNRYTKWLACDTMKGNLFLRTRRNGDRLVINAGGSRRKLKDYLIDEKVPASRRDSMVLLCDEDTVLWVVGYRISEHVKVTERTEQILRIEVLPDKGSEENRPTE